MAIYGVLTAHCSIIRALFSAVAGRTKRQRKGKNISNSRKHQGVFTGILSGDSDAFTVLEYST